jgi:DNA-binding beta-propeller fold protein YncE/ABC-type Fe3+ transport system permease subunit
MDSATWAAAIATCALVLGWWPGRVLGGMRSRQLLALLGGACLLPICLPDYLLYWSWWQAWPIDSALHRWAVAGDQMHIVRGVTLLLGLVCWCWPIAAWMVAASGASPERVDLLSIETRSRVRRNLLLARENRSALAVAWIILFALVFNHTTSFDLAQVRTLGYELRAMLTEGSSLREVVAGAWPGVAVTVVAGLIVGVYLVGRGDPTGDGGRSRPTRLSVAAALAVVICCAVAPIALLWKDSLDPESLIALRAGYSRAAINTAVTAAIAGGISAVVAVGFAAGLSDGRRFVRIAAGALCALALAPALLPAAAVAASFEAAYNVPFPSNLISNLPFRFDEEIYRTGTIIVLGHLARFGFVAVLLGWWLVRSEDPVMRDVRNLEGSGTIAGLWRACGRRWGGAGVATFAIVFALSVGEVGLTALIQPPGFDAVSAILLNNMHYQRDDLVLVMGRALTVIGATAAVVAVLFTLPRPRTRRYSGSRATAASWLAAGCALLLLGCEEPGKHDGENVRAGHAHFGEPGRSVGQFVYPRAMDLDPDRGFLFVIDRSGRMQRFGLDGVFQKQWLLPKYDNGYPTGITIAPDGRIFVADTHEHCISVFTADGALLEQFGEFGTGQGQFVFPSDVAFGPGGRVYVSEFGDNDRIQVFEPDWTFVRQFGRFGSAPGELNRPQSMSFNSAKTELFVADACNHRIQVFDVEGNLLRVFGSAGTETGKFRYPYGVVHLSDDTIAVTEFGNHRVQILDRDGNVHSSIGSPGEGEGQLLAPWTSAPHGNELYVLDSRNSRVQVFDLSGD